MYVYVCTYIHSTLASYVHMIHFSYYISVSYSSYILRSFSQNWGCTQKTRLVAIAMRCLSEAKEPAIRNKTALQLASQWETYIEENPGFKLSGHLGAYVRSYVATSKCLLTSCFRRPSLLCRSLVG